MPLPKLVRPEFSTSIPSSGRKIKYQPFSVREEKVLISASESGDPDEITNAISNVLEASITTPDFRVQELALFDVEYIFLKARSKSIGEKIDVRITDPDDPDCTVTKSIYVDKIGVEKTEGHTNLIKVNDEVMVKMRYPDIQFFAEGIDLSSVKKSIDIVARCVESITSGEEVYSRAEMTDNEMIEWLEDLTTEQYRKFTEFFDTMPKLKHVVVCRNEDKGRDFRVVLEGLADFF